MILPGLFELLEKIVGPLLIPQKTSIISGLLGSDGTAGGIMGVIGGVLGKMEDEKVAEIKAQVEVLLAQVQSNELQMESKSSFWRNPRLFFEWILVAIGTIHFSFCEIINIAYAYKNGVALAPLDTATLFFMGSMLGIYVTAKTVESVNYNNNQ